MRTRYASHHINRVVAFVLTITAFLLLSACTNIIQTRVTTFQQWPDSGLNGTWRFDPIDTRAASLEHQAYLDIVRQEMLKIGFNEAKNLADARFLVSIDYGNRTNLRTFQQAVTDPFPQRSWVTVQGRDGVVRHHTIEQVGMNTRFETVTRSVFQMNLNVKIVDTQQNDRVVYEATAVHEADTDILLQVMPWLARSIFAYFPDATGTVRTVRFEAN